MHVSKARLRDGWERKVLVLAGHNVPARGDKMHLISSGISDHVGSMRLRLSGHRCNGRDHWRSGDSHCRHEANQLLVRAADVRRLRLQRRELRLLLLLLLALLVTSILAVKLALDCFGAFYDVLDFVYSFIVAAGSAHRLNKVVQHSPGASRDFAQEAFLSCCMSRSVGNRLSCSRGHHCKLSTKATLQ